MTFCLFLFFSYKEYYCCGQWCISFCVDTWFHFSWVVSGSTGPYGNSINFLKDGQLVLHNCTILHSHNRVWRFLFLHFLTSTYIFFLSLKKKLQLSLWISRCAISRVVSHCFDLHFPSDWWYWASFHVLTGHFISFLEGMNKSFAHFKIGLSFFSVVRFLYILDTIS